MLCFNTAVLSIYKKRGGLKFHKHFPPPQPFCACPKLRVCNSVSVIGSCLFYHFFLIVCINQSINFPVCQMI